MFPLTKLRIADAKDLEKIHQGTLEVLEKTGIIMEAPEAVAIFKQAGATVDGKLVKIPPQLVENAIQSAPENFTLTARNPEHSILIGIGQKNIHVEPNHGPVFIQSLKKGKNLGTIEDLANLYKLSHSSRVCDIVGSIPVEPSDLPANKRRPRIFYELLKNTDKAIRFVVGDTKEVAQDFEMLEEAVGKKGWLDDNYGIYFSMNPLSPLCYDHVPLETIIAYAKRNQPLAILTCALSGVSSPLSLYGSAILQNAEILAGLTLAQLVNKGVPVMYCPASARANMQNGAYITGSPESNMINIINFQLALEMYKLPIRAMAGMTDSKTIDAQAGYETMQNLMMCLLAGAHVINETLGVLDSIMTTSYEKYVLDEEAILRVKRMQESSMDFDTNLDIELINKIGPRGSYLMDPSTLKNCRKIFRAPTACFSSYDQWVKDGERNISLKAEEQYLKRLKEAPDSFLSPEGQKALEKYFS